MPTPTYRLPDFLVLLPEKPGGEINPHFQEIRREYHSWARRKLGRLFAIEIYNAEIPLIAALTFPLASYKELRGVLDYMTVSLMVEELTDRYPKEKVASHSQLWMRTLRQDDQEQSSPDPFTKIMREELVPNIRASIGPFHWQQFVDSNEIFAKSLIKEAIDRETHSNEAIFRTIQSYMDLRRESIGALPCIVLMRSCRRLYIPDDVLSNPVIKEMENATLEMVFIANVRNNIDILTPYRNRNRLQDVYSFKKEWGDNGALNNILTVMQRDPTTRHLDLQQRLDHAEKLFKASLDRFRECRQRLPLFDEELDRHVAAYADGLIDWITGNIQWSLVTRRYDLFVNDADKKRNIVRLDSNDFVYKLQKSVTWIVSFLFFDLYYSILSFH